MHLWFRIINKLQFIWNNYLLFRWTDHKGDIKSNYRMSKRQHFVCLSMWTSANDTVYKWCSWRSWSQHCTNTLWEMVVIIPLNRSFISTVNAYLFRYLIKKRRKNKALICWIYLKIQNQGLSKTIFQITKLLSIHQKEF